MNEGEEEGRGGEEKGEVHLGQDELIAGGLGGAVAALKYVMEGWREGRKVGGNDGGNDGGKGWREGREEKMKKSSD